MDRDLSNSELRIYRNKCRRRRQLRRLFFHTLVTSCLILTLALSVNVFLSNAKSDKDKVMYKYYSSVTVQPGDTLWSFAKEHSGTEYLREEDYIAEVMKMNYMKDETITAGQNIIIPYYSSEFVE